VAGVIFEPMENMSKNDANTFSLFNKLLKDNLGVKFESLELVKEYK
jgi:hypothetical protein